MTERQRFADEKTLQTIHEMAIGVVVGIKQLTGAVKFVISPHKALVRPGIGIHMHRNPKPMQGISFVALSNAFSHHILSNIAIGGANESVVQRSDRALACGKSTISGKKVERNPDIVVGEFLEIPVVEQPMGRTDAAKAPAIVKLNHAAVGGIIDILGAVGDRFGFSMVKAC